MSAHTPQSSVPPFSCLICLDLNGTLVYRTLEQVKSARFSFRGRNKKYVYKRRGADELILGLAKCGFTVCLLSSMASHNVREIVSRSLSADSQAVIIDRLLTGEQYHKRDTSEGAKEHDTVRDVDAVWKAFPSFFAEKTVFVDDEARKFERASRCGLVVPQLGPTNFKDRDEDLPSLLKYFENMARDSPSDVRLWMEEHPWEPPQATKFSADTSLESSFARLAVSPALSTASVGGSLSSPSSAFSPSSPTRGISLQFVCLEDGFFTFHGSRNNITVKGPATAPFRLDAKMDYQRLVDAAEAHGINLEITADPISCKKGFNALLGGSK